MYIKCILTESGDEHVWLNQADVPSNISKSVKLKLIDLYSLTWRESVLRVLNVWITEYLNKILN